MDNTTSRKAQNAQQAKQERPKESIFDSQKILNDIDLKSVKESSRLGPRDLKPGISGLRFLMEERSQATGASGGKDATSRNTNMELDFIDAFAK